MITALTVAATATAGVVGLVAGLLWSATGWAPLPPGLAAFLVACAAIADYVVSPLSVRRQVPQAWGRLFAPAGAALLYGARLGPGPLTILNTWLWWAALVIAATTGPWPAAMVSAAFAASRVVVMVMVGDAAGRWKRRERPAALGLAVVTVAGAVLVAGFVSGPSEGRATAAQTARPRIDQPRSVPAKPPDATLQRATAATSELASRLPADAGPGFVRLEDDPAKGLGPLDLASAAAVEDDASAERALLETRAFEVGHARAWTTPDGRTAYVAVYQFGSPAGAVAYQRDGTITLEGRGVSHYEVDAPAGALGFSDAGDAPDGGRSTHGVAFVRGRHFVLVLLTTRSGGPDDQATARALAIATAALNTA